MKIVEFNGVSVEYEGREAVSDISFSLDRGDFLSIVGENGSGKSTVVRTMLGLIDPASGSIVFHTADGRSGAGYLPQQRPAQKDFPASVYEIVISGCLARHARRPFYNAADKKLVSYSMERLSITSLKNACYRDLSGGQQQRVLLARALCAARDMLVLDEPAAGLDPVISAGMCSLLKELNRSEGLTVVMVSHEIRTAAECATRILHMGGRALFFGTPEEYRNSETGRRFLGYAGCAL